MQTASRYRLPVLIARIGWIPILAIGLRLASSETADASFLLLSAFALAGRAQAVQALSLSWFFSFISPGIAPDCTYPSLGRYAVIAAAAISVLISGYKNNTKRGTDRLVIMTLLFGVIIITHSILFSPILDVSILKGLSWSVTMVTLLAACNGLSFEETLTLESWIHGGLVLIALISLPLLVLPLGYMRNGTGFQGILSHPQVYGPTMALLGAWTLGRMTERRPPPWSSICLVLLCLALIVKSETRTAGLAMVLGYPFSLFISPMITRRPFNTMAPALKSSRFKVLLIGAALATLLLGSQLLGLVSHFVSKGGRVSSVNPAEVYLASRGILIESMFKNIKQQPWTGVGFGIASETSDLTVSRDPLFHLPISAPIEKGVAPVMVVEELGIPGAAFFLAWSLICLRRAATRGIAAFSLLTVLLLLNLGEATLFSPGGLGLLTLILLSLSVARSPMTSLQSK